jgi:hypothetical protein
LQQAFHCPFPSTKYRAITHTEIAKIIKSLKPKCLYGYIFPDRLKYAEIKLLFKNGDTKKSF